MSDFSHHTPRLLTEADALADLNGTPRPGDLPPLPEPSAEEEPWLSILNWHEASPGVECTKAAYRLDAALIAYATTYGQACAAQSAARVVDLEAEVERLKRDAEQKSIDKKINARHAKSVLMDLIDAERRDAYEQGRATCTLRELAEFQKATGCDTAAQFLAMPWDVLRDRMLGTQGVEATEITDEQIANCFPTVKVGGDPVRLVWFTRNDVIKTVRNVQAALTSKETQ
jgi:hypothetical protein